MDSIYSSLRAWAEVDLDAVLANHNAMRRLLPKNVGIAAVIKADAYGHGARSIARLLEQDVEYFAVAMTDEAEELRRDAVPVAPGRNGSFIRAVPFQIFRSAVRHDFS